MTRQEGYYWVIHLKKVWEIAYWNGKKFMFIAWWPGYDESAMVKIDEHRIERKEDTK